MPKAIDILMTEHRLIEKVLGSLGTLAARLREGEPLERARAAQFGEFFGSFADAVHHGKEEDLLFARMVDYGFSREGGPIAVMLQEHVGGRRLVGTIKKIGAAVGPASDSEVIAFLESASSYPDLLFSHIQKEDRILYPMAADVLPPKEMDRLAEQYADFEERVVGRGAIDRLQELAERLIVSFPPDTMRIEQARSSPSCFAR